MADLKLAVEIASHESGASGAFGGVQKAAEGLGESMKHVGEVAAGFVIGSAFNDMGNALEHGIEHAADFGQEVLKLQRTIGGTAESVSSMLGAMERFGIDGDAASKSLGIFSKNIEAYENSTAKAQGASTGFAGAVNRLGLDLKDADGNLLPMNDIILQTAEKFKDMPDGIEKTADAMALFGKSGKDMILFLNQGKEGLQEAMDTATKYGLTLTGSNLDAVRKFGLAHKDMDEAMQGLTMQLGLAFMPALAKGAEAVAGLAQAFNSDGMPALRGFGTAVDQVLSGDFKGAMDTMGTTIGAMLPMIQDQLGGWAQAFVGWVAPMIPPFLLELGKLLLELVGWLGDQMPAIGDQLGQWGQAFVDWVGPQIPPLLAELGKMLTSLGEWLLDPALPALAAKLLEWGIAFVKWVAPQIIPLTLELGKLLIAINVWILTEALPAIVGKLVEWGKAFIEWIAEDVLPALPGALAGVASAIGGWIGETATTIASWAMQMGAQLVAGFLAGLANLGSQIQNAIQGAVNTAISNIHMPALPSLPAGIHIPGNAAGTDFWGGGPSWVGEQGPEIVNLPRGAQVIPNAQTGGGRGSSNPVVAGDIVLQLDGREIARVTREQLLQLGRRNGNAFGDLGIAVT